jgi:hypothetical protein
MAMEGLPDGYTVDQIWVDLLQTAKIARDLDNKK